jgi:hypothetical protein
MGLRQLRRNLHVSAAEEMSFQGARQVRRDQERIGLRRHLRVVYLQCVLAVRNLILLHPDGGYAGYSFFPNLGIELPRFESSENNGLVCANRPQAGKVKATCEKDRFHCYSWFRPRVPLRGHDGRGAS